MLSQTLSPLNMPNRHQWTGTGSGILEYALRNSVWPGCDSDVDVIFQLSIKLMRINVARLPIRTPTPQWSRTRKRKRNRLIADLIGTFALSFTRTLQQTLLISDDSWINCYFRFNWKIIRQVEELITKFISFLFVRFPRMAGTSCWPKKRANSTTCQCRTRMRTWPRSKARCG